MIKHKYKNNSNLLLISVKIFEVDETNYKLCIL